MRLMMMRMKMTMMKMMMMMMRIIMITMMVGHRNGNGNVDSWSPWRGIHNKKLRCLSNNHTHQSQSSPPSYYRYQLIRNGPTV